MKKIQSKLAGGGRWWIRTTEVKDNRFTVCPIWPLWKSPILNNSVALLQGEAKSVCAPIFAIPRLMELVDGLEPPTC